jgi:hypothetical protein
LLKLALRVLVPRIEVWMKLLGEPAVGLLDVLLRGVSRHAEKVVRIGVGHRVSSLRLKGAWALIIEMIIREYAT